MLGSAGYAAGLQQRPRQRHSARLQRRRRDLRADRQDHRTSGMIDDAEEVVADVIEHVVEETHDALNGIRAKFGFLGLVVGLATGAAGGYFLAQRRLQTKYSTLADNEIAEMREHYQAKG